MQNSLTFLDISDIKSAFLEIIMKKIFNKRNINELGIRAYDKKNTILHDLQFHDFMCKHTLKFSINCTSTASYTHIIAFGELNFYNILCCVYRLCC